jgi:hypothetical protein
MIQMRRLGDFRAIVTARALSTKIQKTPEQVKELMHQTEQLTKLQIAQCKR